MLKMMKLTQLLMVTVLFAGCASQVVKKDETPAMKIEQTKENHVVQKGDSLWKISDKKYSDPFQWPILFRANRDQLEDPDLIEVGQQLDVKKDMASEEINDAIQKAKDTPPFKSHATPRKKLPLKY